MKRINRLVLILAISFISVINVKAANITVDKSSEKNQTAYGASMYYKKVSGSNTELYCSQFYKPLDVLSYNLDSTWDKNSKDAVAIGYILNYSAPYAVKEIAINAYLGTYGCGGDGTNGCRYNSGDTCEYRTGYLNNLSSSCKYIETNDPNNAILNIVEVADQYSKSYKKGVSLSFSNSQKRYRGNKIELKFFIDYSNISNNIKNDIDYEVSFDDEHKEICEVVEKEKDMFTVHCGQISNKSISKLKVNLSTVYYTASKRYVASTNADSNQALILNEKEKLSRSSESEVDVVFPSLTIKKLGEDNEPLKGAVIKITGPGYSGSPITTDGSDIVINNLEPGKYIIVEDKAPDGYNRITDPQTVIIPDDPVAPINDLRPTITLTNTLTETVISKKNAVDGDELPGATLEVLDKDKNKMACTIIDEEGNKKDLEECSWISREEPTTIVGLPKGKYFLKETIAPEGYELSKSMVEFEVLADGNVTEVEMIDELEVEVPNTLSARSALLLTIAMIDIALGIGIITYVKKNKLEQ